MSLYGFFSDRSLIDPTKRIVNLETLGLRCGFLSREMIEYFVEPLELNDRRQDRLTITYRPELGDAPADYAIALSTITDVLVVGAAHIATNPDETATMVEYANSNGSGLDEILPTGPMTIPRYDDIKLTFDATKLTPTEQSALSHMTDSDMRNLFNIVELFTYGTIRNDNSSDVNAMLLSDAAFNNYIAGSVRGIADHTLVYLYGGVNISRFVPKSFTFKYAINGQILEFVIWVDIEAFRAHYPLTTILSVIPPLDLPTLKDPSGLNDPFDSVIISKHVGEGKINADLISNDIHGFATFYTRYIYRTKTYMFGFEILYRGRTPNQLEMRQAIAEYLLNSGVATRAIWEKIFPDIFVENFWYFIPLWDQITELTNVDIYPSIIDYRRMGTIFDKMSSALPIFANDYSVMTTAYDRIFIGVGVGTINIIKSLLEVHPTYRDFSTTDVGFIEMNSEDKGWSIAFNQALAVSAGEVNDGTFSVITIGGKDYITFIRNRNAYLIMTKASYMAGIIL